ncbi:nuclear transport factor 2 family protein [Puniceibacterium confluentis]|uniref:nuclear transport factor 2 family protein n=1 Tax=Puniceibacterium confluentis TaxID=1958944 RepID=UPI0011B7B03C|nr:nuclear transport factor 2 family protein [Puniceibacterium confluentis]
MQGFDPKFRDFPDYVLGVSEEIWEGRGLGAKLRAYSHGDIIQRSPAGITFGTGALVAEAMALQATFPDRRVLGEDVIWSGSPAVGMLGSHRQLVLAAYGGGGPFDAPTGTALRYREIADVYAKANLVSDVWRVCDTGAITRQLGTTPHDWARANLADQDPETQPFRPAIDVIGPYTGRGNSSQWGAAFADLLERVMQGDLSVIAEQYDRACQLEYPGGVTGHGWQAAETFWLGLRASFPTASFAIHHQIGLSDPPMPPRAALRWSLSGRHGGWGSFGAPSGAEVHVMGISHAEFGPWGLRREWSLLDETAIWMQILNHRGG